MNDETSRSLAIQFEESIAPYAVLIEAQWNQNGQVAYGWGTGFVVAVSDGAALVVTARHVIAGCIGDRITWQVSRGFVRTDTPRIVRFETSADYSSGRDDAGFRLRRDERYDVAELLVPRQCVDGRAFMEQGDEAPGLLDPRFYAKPGTQIAWAGFPCVARSCCDAPVLCLYHGIVSATVANENAPPIYLVDGHVAPGVSGGPVWAVRDGQASICGVVSGYWPHAEMAGLCHFVPLNPLGLAMQFSADQ